MKEEIIIRLEREDEYRKVEELVRDAFWNVYRPGCNEHYILHCYRSDPNFVPEFDFVMEKNGKLIGQIMFVRSFISYSEGKQIPVMTFGPISIAPAYKRKGYGTKLLEYAMEKAKEKGVKALLITGNIDFYGKLGFEVARMKNIYYEDDVTADYLLLKVLEPNALKGISGTYKDPEGYSLPFTQKEDFDAYESTFPKKKKEKLPGQLFDL